MGKLFNLEGQYLQKKQELMQQEASGGNAIDSEAALHMQLLAETDDKLERIGARLDRVYAELNRWAQLQHEREQAKHGHSGSQRRYSPLVTLLSLLVFGAAVGAAYTGWQYSKASQDNPGDLAVQLSNDAEAPAKAEKVEVAQAQLAAAPAPSAPALMLEPVPQNLDRSPQTPVQGPGIEIAPPHPVEPAAEEMEAQDKPDESETAQAPSKAAAPANGAQGQTQNQKELGKVSPAVAQAGYGHARM